MSIGYQLEQLKARGKEDDARYMALTTFEEMVAYLVEDGYADSDLTDALDAAIERAREDTDDGDDD